MTHRQYLAWQWWLDDQMNRPSRSDYYQMQTAAEARYHGRNKPAGFKVSDMHVEFVDRSKPLTEGQRQDKIRRNQQAWVGNIGGQVRTQTISAEQMERLLEMSPEDAARERMRLARA